jgi:hypothetical protein
LDAVKKILGTQSAWHRHAVRAGSANEHEKTTTAAKMIRPTRLSHSCGERGGDGHGHCLGDAEDGGSGTGDVWTKSRLPVCADGSRTLGRSGLDVSAIVSEPEPMFR